MTRTPLIALLPTLALLAGCSEGAECTEFTGQEQTIAVEHAFGLTSDDDPAEEATGTATTALDDLVGDREDGFGTVLTVFDSKASAADEAGLHANAVILAQVQRTGSGPTMMDVTRSLPTTTVDVAGEQVRRARLTTTDDVVYTVWTLPGEERSLDVVLAQSKDSAAEEDLADEVPGLVSLDGCDG